MATNSDTVNEFLREHNIVAREDFNDDLNALSVLINIDISIDDALRESIAELSTNTTWAMTRTMLARTYEEVAGGFVCLLTGAWASLEVICRAALEASVNVSYVLERDTELRLSQYVTSYFEETPKAIERYERLIAETSGNNEAQLASVADAREMLKLRKDIVQAVFKTENISFGQSGWPKGIFERFKESGREFEYREMYASLSAQTHNDADALIDFIVVTVIKEHALMQGRNLGGKCFSGSGSFCTAVWGSILIQRFCTPLDTI